MRRGLAAVVAVLVTLAGPAYAAWSDSASTTSGPIGALTVPAPTAACGSALIGGARFTWNSVAGASGYRLYYGSGASQTMDVDSSTTSVTITGLIASGTFRVRALRTWSTTTWNSVDSNSLSYSVLLGLLSTCG